MIHSAGDPSPTIQLVRQEVWTNWHGILTRLGRTWGSDLALLVCKQKGLVMEGLEEGSLAGKLTVLNSLSQTTGAVLAFIQFLACCATQMNL